MGTLLTVLGGMLGIGTLRTYEKQKGLTKWFGFTCHFLNSSIR
jgi:hypothetical protein